MLLVLLLIVVSWLALMPKPPPTLDLGWDKLNHMAAFAALAFTASLGWPGSVRMRALVLGALLAYGGLIELVQMQVPGRSAEWADLVADAVGLLVGAAAASLLLHGSRRRPAHRVNSRGDQ